MRLARDDQLHWASRVQKHGPESLRVAEHQREALVGRDTAGEPDGEDVRVKHALDPAKFGVGGTPLYPRRTEPTADVADEALAQNALGAPEVSGRDTPRRLPALILLGSILPNLCREQVADLARNPGSRVHPIGDRPDRHLVGVETRPEPGEHASAHRAVEQAHPVGTLAQTQAHHGHVEHGGVAAVVVLGAKGENPFYGHPRDSIVSTEVLADEVAGESVNASRHRSVRGEHGACAGSLKCLVEREVL
ncbi:unannotated protein [freshwater metagenome]|uniref:Unannotated protein n=1 Tax=freshwater metagenome TaxID=449393 RepID=A0A6J7C3P7_9ZZZZ